MFLKQTSIGDGGSSSGGGGGGGDRVVRNKKRIARTWTFKLPKDHRFSPVRLLKQLGAKVTSAIRVVSMRKRSLRKVSSSTLVRSLSLPNPTDLHRAKAVEDCIEFLHSSSSRERPSSVSESSV